MKKIILIVIVLALLFGVYKLVSSNHSNSSVIPDDKADLILFWGDGCPHCATLEKYISDNQLDSKFKINRKEVWYNKSNQNLLEATIKNCQPAIDTSGGMGVPFAFVNSTKKCLIGDQPIIDWLSAK